MKELEKRGPEMKDNDKKYQFSVGISRNEKLRWGDIFGIIAENTTAHCMPHIT